MVDIGEIDYAWQLEEATEKLFNFVSVFDVADIGLTSEYLSDVCPQADINLYTCTADQAQIGVNQFRSECIDYISIIFEKGKDDLILKLGTVFIGI